MLSKRHFVHLSTFLIAAGFSNLVFAVPIVPGSIEFTRQIEAMNIALVKESDSTTIPFNLDPLAPPAPTNDYIVSGNIQVPFPVQGVSYSTINATYTYSNSRIASYIFSGVINKGQGNQPFVCCNFAGGDNLGLIPAAGVNFGPKTFPLENLIAAFFQANPQGSFVSARIQSFKAIEVDHYNFSACTPAGAGCTVPEPSTLSLLVLAFVGLIASRSRRNIASLELKGAGSN